MPRAAVRDDVVAVLRCPHGEPSLTLEHGTLACRAGHRFDIARQGYVNLLPGAAPAGVETARMVAARATVQAAGLHQPLTEALTEVVRADAVGGQRTPGSTIVDLGAGTGHHLAAVVEDHPVDTAVGVAVDLSKHAARRAARAHPRVGAVVADVWASLPIRDAVADVVLDVFAPRNAAEIGRILRPEGLLVVVTPAPGHLMPLVDRLGLIGTEAAKLDHLDERLREVVRPVDRRELTWTHALGPDEALALVESGPNAWHTDAERVERDLAMLPRPIDVSFAVTVSVYRR